MKSQINSENFEKWNEEMVHQFDIDQFHNHPFFLVRYVIQKRIQAIMKLMDPKPGEKVLEVGCGSGQILDKITIPDIALYGIDISPTLVQRAKKLLGKRAKIEKANAENLPFPDQYFDKIFCTEVLEHVLQPDKVIHEMIRVAKPKAKIIISIPHEKGIDFCKKWLVRLGLFNCLILSKREDSYKMSKKMTDDWHLHTFDLNLLRSFVPENLLEKRIICVPLRVIPLHYIVSFQIKKDN